MRINRLRIKLIFLGMVLLLFPVTNSIIFAADGQTLTLSQAIDLALKFDYTVRTASNTLETAKLAVKQQILLVFPQAVINGVYEYDLDNQTYPNNYSIIISENIPTNANLYGEKVVSNIDAAVWDQVYDEAQLQITKATVIFNTIQDYLNALKAQSVLNIQQEAVKNAQAANDLSSEQLRLGAITKTTQLQAENNLANASLTLEQNQADYELALQQLGSQIGITDLSKIILVDDTKNLTMGELNFDQFREKALKNRLEMQQAQITIKKAELAWAQASNQELPTIDLSYNNISDTQSYSISYNFLSGNLGWNAAQQSQNYVNTIIPGLTTNQNSYYFGPNETNYALKFSWNLDFGIARNLASQAKFALDSAKISQQQAIQTINSDLNQAIHDYQIAAKKTETNQKLIPYYQKDLEIKKLQNQLGTISKALDVSTAELNLLQAQSAVVQASYDQLVAFQKLKLVSGELYPFDKNMDESIIK